VRFDRLMEQVVGVVLLLVLAGGALFVIAPFMTALLWGAILAYCSWHPFQRLTAICGGHRALSTLIVVALILCVLIGPILYGGFAFATRVPDLTALAQTRLAAGVPPLPDWVAQLPFVGPRIDEAWTGLASRNPEVVARLRELAGPMLRQALGAALSILQGMGLLLLSVLFAAVFYISGQSAAAALTAAMRRVAGARADSLLALIGATVKGVVFGILGTSLVQAVLLAIGYWVAGLQSPGLLGLVSFFLAFIPAGPLLVVVPAVISLVQNAETGWAVFLLVWSVAIAISVDNVLKPILIGKSSHVPFILVMIGVLGGAAAFGLLGVFVGPTLLAVAHAVLRDWTMGEAAAQREAVPARPAMPRGPGGAMGVPAGAMGAAGGEMGAAGGEMGSPGGGVGEAGPA
jgi:predicted PurR-regulated permease PerM